MYTLGIETTCDETAVAIVTDKDKILSNIIYSQSELHRKYGGVFPELACRKHMEVILPVIDEALKEAELFLEQIDLIAASYGPGLMGAILIGLNCAKALSLSLKKPFLGVNHLEAHLYASMMGEKKLFPSLGVVLSGGHTYLVRIEELGTYQLIGSTIDDAIGEAFDKVASMLDLPYPGGPEIENLALSGDPKKYDFQLAPMQKRPLDFSFSGLKTKVLYTVKGQKAHKDSATIICEEEKKHIAASFQYAAFEDVIKKIQKALSMQSFQAIYFGGGVTQNQMLKKVVKQKISYIPTYWPEKNLSLDNAAMIAALGCQKFLISKKGSPLDLAAQTRIPFSP